MPEEEPLYVGVIDPIELRKDLLNSSKIIISSLRKYENFNAVKDEKVKYLVGLAKTIREINALNRRLMHIMPKTKIKHGMIKKPGEGMQPMVVKHAGMRTPAEPAAAKAIKEKTRLAELENELAGVEEKLGKLE